MLAQAAPLDEINWYEAGELALQAGSRLGSAEILFSKIEDATIEAEVQRLAEIQAEPQPLDLKKEISIDDFGKIDLRTGKILTAEAVAGARKLLKFQVEMGPETRQIVSGIAEQFTRRNWWAAK
jgi:methionyl-tRNA synthetase